MPSISGSRCAIRRCGGTWPNMRCPILKNTRVNTVEGTNVEDWGAMLVTFDDGTVAQISAADTVLGGIRNQLIVYGAKAVVLCNINPNDAVQAYAPDPELFAAEYITEKIETKAGWTSPAPDEDWMSGYPAEIQDFVEAVAFGREPLSGGALGRDVTLVIYGAVAGTLLFVCAFYVRTSPVVRARGRQRPEQLPGLPMSSPALMVLLSAAGSSAAHDNRQAMHHRPTIPRVMAVCDSA